jgi:hypothetical protein
MRETMVAWHHVLVEGDEFPHIFARPTDCYCEPEVNRLGNDAMGYEHRVIRHQDMTGKARKQYAGPNFRDG